MLNTQQRIILDLPTTLADLFEYLTSCDDLALIEDGVVGQGGAGKIRVSDILMSYMTVHDIMHLRMVCKSTAQIATPDVQNRAIQAGNMDDSIRVNYWIARTPFFEVINELKRNHPPQSVFTNVFEEIQNRLKESPLNSKLQHQILVDLQRTKNPITEVMFT